MNFRIEAFTNVGLSSRGGHRPTWRSAESKCWREIASSLALLAMTQSRFCRAFRIVLLWLIIVVCLAPLSSFGQSSGNTITPVVMRVLATPEAVKGSDGVYHVVYELALNNVSSKPWDVSRLDVAGAATPQRPIVSYEGNDLKNRMALMAKREPTLRLPGNQGGIIWIHLSFEDKSNIPDRLVHQLQIVSGSKSQLESGGASPISKRSAVRLGSPLKGGPWIAADGCCDSHRHVRALLPINSALYTAQRFAIDWELLNSENKVYAGDKLIVESYLAYGRDIIAVADGRVINAVDGLPNQVPGKLPAGLPVEEADGNHVVQDLGGGRYALYAHMMPGSVRVKRGDKIHKGQVLGRVGNSGNTMAPHLHFHIMDGSSTLGSNGLPYVFDSFEITGRAPTTKAFDRAEAAGTPLTILPSDADGSHRRELPLDLSIVQFKNESS